MGNPAGEANDAVLRLDFDRRLMLQFHGSVVTSDAGLLPYRELDDVLGLTAMASDVLADARTGKNGRHALAGLFRQVLLDDIFDRDRWLDCDAARLCVFREQRRRIALDRLVGKVGDELGHVIRILICICIVEPDTA